MSRTKCKTCKYAHNDGGNYYCCYILETEHRRPCPAGDACTVYEPDHTSQGGGASPMTAPCKDCKERTAHCHCTCSRYREYAEDNQRQLEQKYMANKIKDDIGAVVSTSIKRSQRARQQRWRAYKGDAQ